MRPYSVTLTHVARPKVKSQEPQQSQSQTPGVECWAPVLEVVSSRKNRSNRGRNTPALESAALPQAWQEGPDQSQESQESRSQAPGAQKVVENPVGRGARGLRGFLGPYCTFCPPAGRAAAVAFFLL
jgi:hypothetical protein